MRYIKIVALAALVAVRVSALPLGSRELASADDLVKRIFALDVTDDKRYYGRQILSFRDAADTSYSPHSLHVSSSPVSKSVKRVVQDDVNDDPIIEISDLDLDNMQPGLTFGDAAEVASAVGVTQAR